MKRSLVINKKQVLKETPFASLTTRPLCLRHGGEFHHEKNGQLSAREILHELSNPSAQVNGFERTCEASWTRLRQRLRQRLRT